MSFFSLNVKTNDPFRCKDGSLRAHRNFLRLFCPLLRNIFEDRPELLLDKEAVVVLNDFDVAVVEKFLQFAYFGQTSSADRSVISQVEDLASNHFGIVGGPGKISVEASELAASPPASKRKTDPEKVNNASRSSASVPASGASSPTKAALSSAMTAGKAARTPSLKVHEDAEFDSFNGRNSFAYDPFSYDFDFGEMSKRTSSRNLHELSLATGSFSDRLDTDLEDKRCRFCQTTFLKFNDLVGHFSRIHPGENPFGCHRCEKSFTRRYDLSIHVLRVHEKVMLYRCDICDSPFTNRHSRKRHVQIEHESFYESWVKAEALSFPDLSFDADVSRKVKKERVTTVEPQPMEDDGLETGFRCQKCQSSFETKEQVVGHYHERHQTAVYNICEICKTVCANQRHFALHAKLHDERRRFACNICDYRFPLRETLKRHVMTVHDKVRPYSCEHCGKTFGVRGTLTTHMNMVHSEIAGSHKRGRKRKSNAGIGAVKYEEEDPLQVEEFSCESESSVSVFRCFHCEEQFSDKRKLMHHIETFHLDDDQLEADPNLDESLSGVDAAERFKDVFNG